MFESMGWLCCHALKVLFFDLNFSSIPEKYILKRWSKNAKHENGFAEYTKKKGTTKSSMAIRLNGLMKESFIVMTLAANDTDSEEIARRYLYQARVEITKHQSELYGENCDKNRHKFDSYVDPFIGAKDQILDPIKKKGKGIGYSRMKPKGEKKKKKTSQVTFKSKAGQKHEHGKTMNFDIQSASMQQIQHESMGLSFEVAKMIGDALSECERAPSAGETKRCANSAEDMIDFAISVLGRNVVVRTTENTKGSNGNIMIGSVKGINVRVYEADILDPNSKANINHGVAICHVDTTLWGPKHGAFIALGSEPGKIEVCHWIFENDMTWAIAD
ncbi:hypothetical protein KY290_024401 [Solanum tuberosum]|uniref:BURP domain-containing protein n=1 Tax=Solanum tuberosum TaxID=4113 RepID=A0ABQ7USN0_SOLTU|nr:hypothetical protein KY290_024401 [Solanum tuberosum]